MNIEAVGHTEHDGQQAGQHHPEREKESQVNPLGHDTAEEHEKGVGEQVAGVEETEVGLRLLLRLAIDLCNPRPDKRNVELKSSNGIKQLKLT